MRKRSAEEVEQLLRGYDESGLTRGEYCQQLGIAVTTLDYYRQRGARKAAGNRRAAAKLVRVKMERAPAEARNRFTVVLANGRRIESSWSFAEADLVRLIRAAEA